MVDGYCGEGLYRLLSLWMIVVVGDCYSTQSFWEVIVVVGG